MNLCELPFATVSDRNSGRTTLHFKVDDYDHELGRMVQRTLTVKGDSEFGLPTAKDEEIYLGLMKYTSDYNGFSDPEVYFSRADLFELMDWPKSDWAYHRLTKGMYRLQAVRLQYHHLWRDNRDKQWRDQGAFGILDSFKFRDRRTVGAFGSYAELSSVFRWSSVLFNSFDSRYIKKIDYGLTRSLSPVARRLYRYLDKHFHPPKKTRITMDLAQLAYQHIGISQGIELDKVRKKHIAPAVDELDEAGYLNEPTAGLFTKERRGIWNVSFELAGKRTKSRSGEAERERTASLVEAMENRGISTAKALVIATGHGADEITQAIRAMDEQRRQGNAIRSPDRWFATALKHGYRASSSAERAASRPELRVFRSQRKAG